MSQILNDRSSAHCTCCRNSQDILAGTDQERDAAGEDGCTHTTWYLTTDVTEMGFTARVGTMRVFDFTPCLKKISSASKTQCGKVATLTAEHSSYRLVGMCPVMEL